jgi:hypothetical protein
VSEGKERANARWVDFVEKHLVCQRVCARRHRRQEFGAKIEASIRQLSQETKFSRKENRRSTLVRTSDCCHQSSQILGKFFRK